LFEYRGNQYLLLADEYSKFPIIRKLTSTTSHAIINHLKSIFAEHGIPEKLGTDNGPQYASREFEQFAVAYGFEHVTSSPSYPQSNGSSERMVQTVKDILKKCDARRIRSISRTTFVPYYTSQSSLEIPVRVTEQPKV
jgi:transposase InsO family protein